MADKTVKASEELNLEQKVTVKNIAGWPIGFARVDGVGDVSITAEGSTRLSRNEIISQVQNGNRLFTGVDGKGSHATIFIDDAPTRREIGFESEDGKEEQIVFTDALVGKVFSIKSKASFEKEFTESFKTRAEKFAVINAIKRLKINDYSKIRFAEDYTGYKVQ